MVGEVAAPVREGDILAGRYRVERVLAAGGMGVVVSARHVQLQQKVALKFLLPHVAGATDAAQRFQREARAAALLRSEHIARVIDVGELASGAPYMVMEFLQGRDLAEIIEQDGALPTEIAVEYILQACEGLAEAHTAHIIHRDLKPSNLFRTDRPDGSALIKILDFGISKMEENASIGGAVTSTAAVLGSPLYMSPEQMQSSKNVDVRTDVWSLGVVLQQLLTGKPSFDAETLAGLCVAIATKPPRRLRESSPGASMELENVILKCLEKRPEDRFQNVAELAGALAPFAPEARIHVERTRRLLLGATAPPLEPSQSRIRIETSATQTDPLGRTKTALAGSQPSIIVKKTSRVSWIAGSAAIVALALVGAAAIAVRSSGSKAASTAAQSDPPMTPIPTQTIAATSIETIAPLATQPAAVTSTQQVTLTTPPNAQHLPRANAGAANTKAAPSASAAPTTTALTGFSLDRK